MSGDVAIDNTGINNSIVLVSQSIASFVTSEVPTGLINSSN